MRTGSGDLVYGDEKKMKESTYMTQPAQRREKWLPVRIRFARIYVFPALLTGFLEPDQTDQATRRLIALSNIP